MASRTGQVTYSKKTRKQNLPPPTRHENTLFSTYLPFQLKDFALYEINAPPPPWNKRPPKTVIFQRGEYTKPMSFDRFWNVFLLLLEIKRPGRLFWQIRQFLFRCTGNVFSSSKNRQWRLHEINNGFVFHFVFIIMPWHWKELRFKGFNQAETW